MNGRVALRRAVIVIAVALSSTTLTGCHELYCAFIEGLTGVPVDCSHEAFPDLPDVPIPSLPPPPSLPTTTTTAPAGTTPTSSTTSTTRVSPTSTTPTSVVGPTTTSPGASAAAESVAERLRGMEEPPTRAEIDELVEELSALAR